MPVLTPYDEFPVHQASEPFSFIPSTDYNWDEGYWFGVFNPDDKVFLGTGARVNPNSDMFGGYAFLNVAGVQRTVRFSRSWRRDFKIEIGPWKVEFVEPLKTMHLTLAENDSGISYDLIWEGTSPAFLEDHHSANHRGRMTTDQSRYSQPGKSSGWIKLEDKEWQVTEDRWTGSRDHSWGLYAERPPLAPIASLLPPRQVSEGPKRALRWWTCFRCDPWSGFFHLHETTEGIQTKMNDVFGTPFGGHIYKGWDDEFIKLISASHEMEFEPGTRILKRAVLHLEDSSGGKWRQEFDIASPPWIVQPMGYFPGSWKDGGTFHTYHGSEELAIEWDDIDGSKQPFKYQPYKVSGEHAATSFGTGGESGDMIQGPEYLSRVTTYAPDGSVTTGAAQVELFISGRFDPYGFKDDQ